MALENVSQSLETVEDVMNWMAPYAGGEVPDETNDATEFADWLRWIVGAQEDAAKRGFWGRLLDKTEIDIVADEDTADLPDNFHKRNGIYVLKVGTGEDAVDWNENNNSDGQRLHVFRDPEDGKWRVRFIGFTPTESVTGELWYFFNPPKPTELEDPLFLDGEMIGFGALKEYFRKNRQFGSLDDARIEYENRYEELLGLEVLPTPQELVSWKPYHKHMNQSASERVFYQGRPRRSWRH